jgi:predicted transcriptional regulator
MVSLLLESKKGSSNSHRGRLDIIADILEASSCETRKTYLMYRCNMSFKQLKYYLDFLLRKQLLHTVAEDLDPNFGLFKITDKGREFLRVYKGLKSLVK